MNNLALADAEKNIKPSVRAARSNWTDNPSVQRLLDVVVSILTEEYIQIAKENPDVFPPHPNPLPRLREREKEKNGENNESGNIRAVLIRESE